MLLCEGGHFTLVPNVLKKIYGDKATELYGYLFSYTGLCAIFLILLQTEFLDDEDASSYDIFFYINGGISMVSMCLLVLFFREEKFQV